MPALQINTPIRTVPSRRVQSAILRPESPENYHACFYLCARRSPCPSPCRNGQLGGACGQWGSVCQNRIVCGSEPRRPQRRRRALSTRLLCGQQRVRAIGRKGTWPAYPLQAVRRRSRCESGVRRRAGAANDLSRGENARKAGGSRSNCKSLISIAGVAATREAATSTSVGQFRFIATTLASNGFIAGVVDGKHHLAQIG